MTGWSDAIEIIRTTGAREVRRQATACMAGLTTRQRQILDMVLDGQPSKNIAADLRISQRTVEKHRAEIMKRTGARSLPALARIALFASLDVISELEMNSAT